MNDRLPGSCWNNPVWYGKYRIYLANLYEVHGFEYEYCHDDYDGAEDAGDSRYGQAHSIAECQAEIDAREDS